MSEAGKHPTYARLIARELFAAMAALAMVGVVVLIWSSLEGRDPQQIERLEGQVASIVPIPATRGGSPPGLAALVRTADRATLQRVRLPADGRADHCRPGDPISLARRGVYLSIVDRGCPPRR